MSHETFERSCVTTRLAELTAPGWRWRRGRWNRTIVPWRAESTLRQAAPGGADVTGG